MNGPLLRWFEPRRRAYPWRARPTPFRVLVSEVMLQQTQAARVAEAFPGFARRFPSVGALAAASPGEVLRAWGSLGYNRRAVALHAAARQIVRDHAGRVPRDPIVLRSLPGVGPYTSAAVASLAFGTPVPAIDVNVRRVVARARLGVDGPLAGRAEVESAAAAWIDRSEPGAWNQALMDLGREICRPVPRCEVCPIARRCAFRTREAPPAAPPRRQPRFEGSSRQGRGRVVAALRGVEVLSVAGLTRRTGIARDRVVPAVRSLARDALVEAGPAALAGLPRGRVRLPR